MKLLTIAALLGSVSAHAATISIDGITGQWEAPIGGDNIRGAGTSNLKWGQEATSAGQSGYRFEAQATSFDTVNSPFYLGAMWHDNNPIFSGGGITGADLRLSVTGTVDGVAFTMGGVYGFDHFETPNTPSGLCAAGGPPPCADLVTFTGVSDYFGDTLQAGGEEFVFNLDGFEDSFTFLTDENNANSTGIYASFSSSRLPPAPVPLPASVLLLGAAVAGLGALRRRIAAC